MDRFEEGETKFKKHLELHEKRMQKLKKEHQRKIRNMIVGRKPRRPWRWIF